MGDLHDSNRQARGIDRISELPDELLCHILSFLSTNCAFQTSLLSPRWKLLFTSLPVLDFHCELPTDWRAVLDFMRRFNCFVDHIFNLRGSTDIQSFRLFCNSSVEFYNCILCRGLSSWVRNAIKCNVRTFDLHYLYFGEGIETLFTCTTLVVLKLNVASGLISVPSSVCLPSIKVIHLDRVCACNFDHQSFFSGCPLLEELFVRYYYSSHFKKALKLNIVAPALKRLSLDLRKNDKIEEEVVISAPNLEDISVTDFSMSKYIVKEVSSALYKVMVNVGDCLVNRKLPINYEKYAAGLLLLFKGISKVQYLSLAASTIMILDNGLDQNMPVFSNLTHLELNVQRSSNGELVLDFLNHSPNLEVLVLDDTSCCSRSRKEFDWLSLHRVPSCLSSHLKKINIRGFGGRTDQMKIIEFLMKNGEVLDEINISFSKCSLKKKLQLHKEITTLPKASKACKIVL